MRVMIIGATGFIGRAICAELSTRNVETVSTSRTGSGAGDRHVNVDRTDTAAMLSIVRDTRPDAVIDVMAMTEAQTKPLLHVLRGEIGSYVLISSCDVYRNYGLLCRRETGEALLTSAVEDAELRTSRYPYREATPRAAGSVDGWKDDYDKIFVERAVVQSGLDWTIVRLPMVFGPGDRQDRFGWAVRPMVARQPSIRIPRTWASWTTTYGYMRNIAAAVAHATGHPSARCEVFNVVDFEPTDHAHWIRCFRDVIGWEGDVDLDGGVDGVWAGVLQSIDLNVPLLIDGAKLKSKLHFTPPIDVAFALQDLVASHEARAR